MGQFGGGGNPFFTSGVGAPGSLNKPLGTLYTRTDAQGLYISTPSFTAKTVVQHAHGSGHATHGGVTFGGAVTAGNLLIAIVGFGSDQSALLNAAAWTLLDSANGGNPGFAGSFIAYRYAQAGDGTTPPDVFTGAGGNQFYGITAVEIDHCTGAIATDIVSHTIAGTNGASTTTPNQSTTQPNELCLLLASTYNGTANMALPGGYATVEQWNDGAANYGAMEIGSQTPAGSGTNIGNNTIARATGGNSCVIAAQIILNSTPSPAWTQITIP